MDKESMLILADKVSKGTATRSELALYIQYYNQFQQEQPGWNAGELGDRSEIEGLLLGRINYKLGSEGTAAKIVPLYRKTWIYAAAVILIAFTGALFIFSNNKSSEEFSKIQDSAGLPGNPVPGGNKATLTLADGSDIVLDDARNGAIANQGNTSILKLNSGQLVYRPLADKHSRTAAISKNTLTTPYGGQYKLALSDGSIVWLNSGSSFSFPANFTGNARNVELKGEAYFEIAENPAMPFKVKVNGMEVTVLGTHFNIMGYDDEEMVKTSLLEGSVKIQNNKTAVLLSPGQQSQLNKKGVIKVIRDADMDQAIAWKNGMFYFDGTEIQTVMRQLARWYNVEVSYQALTDQHFTGKINKDADIMKVLQMLELTEKVHFKVSGSKISVLK